MKPSSKWYSIRASARSPRAAEIFIYGDIGESWWGESVTAAEFVRELTALDVDELTVRISSYGGSVVDGIAMYNAIRRHRATVTVAIDGVACSIASMIAMAGDTVEMAENALLMVHAPWGYAAGNSNEMRDYADLLDTWARAMSTSYAAKTGRPAEEMLALLTDGVDHWYSATEAEEAGFVDSVVSAVPVAAALDLSRFSSMPPAAAAFMAPAALNLKKESTMKKDDGKAQAGNPTPESTGDVAEIEARGARAEAQRRTDIAALGAGRIGRHEGVSELLAACQGDVTCTVEQARSKLLAHLGKDSTPLGGNYVVTVEDERDKFRASAVTALLARAAARDEKGAVIRADEQNPMRGRRLAAIAEKCLERAGVRTEGMSPMQIVGAAFTQTASDFPVLLENTLHKLLLQAWTLQPDTWSRFCKVGSVSDFRAHPRYRVGSLGNLEIVPAGTGEFKNQDIPDGEKTSIAAVTKGSIIAVTRPMIVNDDLGVLADLAGMLGRAGKRTIEQDVYTLIGLNSGMGPSMDDGKTLFHTDHGNTAIDGDLSVAVVDSLREKMALQKDISGNDYLDLRPAILVVRTSSGGLARVINNAQYDPDTPNKLQRPNMVNGLFRDIVDTPRLAGTRVYAFADPAEAPVIEVAFLDGVQEPFLDMEEGFRVDGVQWKVRLDYGVAALDYRGAATAKGSA